MSDKDKYEDQVRYFRNKAQAMRSVWLDVLTLPVPEDAHPDYISSRAHYPLYADDLEAAADTIDELLAARRYQETVANPILSVTEKEAIALRRAAKMVEDLNIQPKSGSVES